MAISLLRMLRQHVLGECLAPDDLRCADLNLD